MLEAVKLLWKPPLQIFARKLSVGSSLLVIEGEQAFFIELKGSDLVEAVRQIMRTVEQLGKKLSGYRFEGRIIMTRVRTPNVKSTDRIKLEKMLRRTGGSLAVKVNWDEVEV